MFIKGFKPTRKNIIFWVVIGKGVAASMFLYTQYPNPDMFMVWVRSFITALTLVSPLAWMTVLGD